jgi:hypothetical protein
MTALLTVKELASELRRTPRYVYEMRRRGFQMPDGRATLEEARSWLARNPAPFSETGWLHIPSYQPA